MNDYPAYKSSGVEWLGDVSTHWEMRRLKFLSGRKQNGATPPTVEPRYYEGGTIPWYGPSSCSNLEQVREPIRYLATESFIEGRAHLIDGPALLIVVIGATAGRMALLMEEGSTNQQITSFELNTTLVNPFFALRQIRSAGRWLRATASTATIPILDADVVTSLSVAFPPLPEQRAIVRYLDHVVERIRQYVSAKERLIALLEEERQAVIHRAVTRGLDPNVPLKPSGVEWLGDVPVHWEVRRLKTVLQPIDRRSEAGSETLLSLRRDHGVVAYDEHFTRPSQSQSLVGYKLVRTGQLVLNRLQANNGLVFGSNLDGLVSPDYSVFEKTSPLRMHFVSDLLRTVPYRTHFRQQSTGLGTGTAGFLRLYDDRFLETKVHMPPLQEQVAIIEHLHKASADIDAAIDRARRQIELLREYRTRIIADVVTGKLDVREAAAELPEGADDGDLGENEAVGALSRNGA